MFRGFFCVLKVHSRLSIATLQTTDNDILFLETKDSWGPNNTGVVKTRFFLPLIRKKCHKLSA